MRRTDNDDASPLLDDTGFCQLHGYSKCDTGLRIIEEAKTIDQRCRIGEFGFLGLVNDAIGRPEASDGLFKADRIADLNCCCQG
jgi:hypothetical protein